MFAAGALAVSRALGAQACGADVGEALGVGCADGVVAEVVDAVAEEVTVLTCNALVVAIAFPADSERTDIALACIAGATAASFREGPC